MSFVGRTREEEQRMLREIGVERFEELLGEVPEDVRLAQPPGIPGPLSEIELRRLLGGWAEREPRRAARPRSWAAGSTTTGSRPRWTRWRGARSSSPPTRPTSPRWRRAR